MSGAENDQILYDLASVMPWNCRNNIVQNQIQKNNKKSKKKHLHFFGWSCILSIVVTLIAMKREVAATEMAGFPWSECQV